MDPISIVMALAQFAPALVKWVSGNDKAEEVAKVAVDVAQKITGAGNATDAIASLKGNPELALQYELAVLDSKASLEAAYLNDLDSARKMQIAALGQDDVFSKRFVYYFAIGWSVFSAIYFLAVTFAQIPPTGQRMADTILGVLIGSCLSSFFQFFYGSTKKSQAKDETITLLSKGK